MDINKYRIKQLEKANKLIQDSINKEMTDAELAIYHLEMMITEIQPYSRAWRHGTIKSLRIAINSIKKIYNLQ